MPAFSPSASEARREFPLRQRWLFRPSCEAADLALEADESSYVEVTVPHTNVLLPLTGFEDRDYQFVSCYRRHLQLPEELRGKRLLVDFEGVMTAARVFFNGVLAGEHRGGYTPFRLDVTEHARFGKDNVLAVEVDSRERADIPPFGGNIDYLTFGGIYRDVTLRAVSSVWLERILVKPRAVLSANPWAETLCEIRNPELRISPDCSLRVVLSRSGSAVAEASSDMALTGEKTQEVSLALRDLSGLELWDVDNPVLYDITVELRADGELLDRESTRFGMRECRFTPDGFLLNGRRIQLRGLNRHQTYPYVGGAMPARVQARDADILRREFQANIVRTSHYPQSPHFLNRCNEIGLLVLEEIPGWQHIGDEGWKELSCENVRRMVLRDFNHPSVILWGVRINESADDDAFYTRTNAVARELDDTRQTGGIRCHLDSNLLEDVFTLNDFSPEQLGNPNHPLYMVTEFGGHMWPTKQVSGHDTICAHVAWHARIQSQAAAIPGIAGAIGWCAFDYHTHANFGSGDRVCYHGIADMFRMPKPAAGVYRAQCDPQEEVVIELGFHWAYGDRPAGNGPAAGGVLINTNCDQLVLTVRDKLLAKVEPDLDTYPGLPHPPCGLQTVLSTDDWGDLRIDGYVNGCLAETRQYSGGGADAGFLLEADDSELLGDGVDMTRVTFLVTDEFGNRRQHAVGAITFELEGPGELVGDNPFALIGGGGAVWVRSRIGRGTIRVRAQHPRLGRREIEIEVPRESRDEL